MKILVGIASFGTKNDRYLSMIIEEYRSMSHDIDLIVFSNIPRAQDTCMQVVVGLPSENPWSLPFAHKRYFADRVDEYDLFIYTENDILIKEKNIDAFLRVTSILPENEIAGFMLYEDDPLNKKNHVDVHGGFHWDPKSVKAIGDYTFAHFTNEHSACYLITREQLKKAIASGGYLTPPREGKYDMLCTAATDPYTQCGFTKVICISHFGEFELHHLPNAYVGKFGISDHEFISQLQALLDVSRGKLPTVEFLDGANMNRRVKRRKMYYEPCEETVLSLPFREVKNVLSIGCGSAATESRLVTRGIECVCIPLDSVIGVLAEIKGIQSLYPDFDKSLNSIAEKKFDCIFMLNIIQHINDPIDFIGKCKQLLNPQGILLGTIPTEDYLQDFFPKRFKTGAGSDLKRYYLLKDILLGLLRIILSKIVRFFNRSSRVDLPTKKKVMQWLKRNGLKVTAVNYATDNLSEKRRKVAVGPLQALFANKLIFVARSD